MTTTMMPPSPAAGGGGGGETPISGVASKGRSRSRPMVAIGLLVAGLGALGAMWLVSSAGDRSDALALARDVPIGQEVTEADLRVVALPDTPGLSLIPADELDEVVGQRAAVGLTEGSVLTRGSLTVENVLDDGEDLVALELARGMGPVTMLDIGDTVQVVPVPEQGAESGPAPVSGRVVEVGQANGSGEAVVHLAVAETDSTQVASWSTSPVALVLTAKR